MPNISLVNVNLTVTVLESHLYGAYVILASYTLYLLIIRHRERRRLTNANHGPRSKSPFLSPVAFGAFIVFITVTAHWLLDVVRLYTAFHDCQAECAGPQRFYSDHSQMTEVLKCGFMVASLLIGDSLIIHRLWVVWAFRTRIIIVPSITLAVLTTFGVGLTYQLSTYSSNDSILEGAFRRWCTGICFSSMCTSMYTTGFIWYKLWDTNRALMDVASGYRSLRTISRIFLDSAAILNLWGLFHAVTFESGSNLQLLAIDCIPVITGISNLLLQIRLHLDFTGNTLQYRESKSRMPTQLRFTSSELPAGPGQLEDLSPESKEDFSSETEPV